MVSFFSSIPYPRASLTRIFAEIHSMMSTSTISPSRIAPTSFQRYELMAKINGAPMPPAPTRPSTVASRRFMSKR